METTRRPLPGEAGVLDGVLHGRTARGLGAVVALIHQYGAAFQQVLIAFQGEVDDGIEQGMARTDEGSQRLALWRHQGFIKGNPLVARQDGFANAYDAVPAPHRGGDVSDFVTAGFSLLDGAAKPLEGFVKEGLDVVGLQRRASARPCPRMRCTAGIHGIGQHRFGSS